MSARRWPAGLRWSAALTLALAAGACIEDGPGEQPDDAGPEAGEGTPCGRGPISLSLGVGNPFEARPAHDFVIEQGLQGGFHIDVSLRGQGALDPDHVDIQIDLLDGETRIARHLTTDWLLHIDRAGPWCDYPRARLVLTDGEGGLLPAERVEALVGRTLELAVYLRSPLGDGDGRFDIVVSELIRFR